MTLQQSYSLPPAYRLAVELARQERVQQLAATQHMRRVELPGPHPAQAEIIDQARRYNVVCAGRRFGKDELGMNRLLEEPILSEPLAWFSPTYKMLLDVWRVMRRLLRPITARSNATERRIELTTGGILDFWSLDNPDVARGRMYKRIVVNEAAYIVDLLSTWQHVLRPTLADLIGDAWFLSTPKGYNGFKALFDRGLDPEQKLWKSWQYPTSANPHISPDEIEDMRQEMPEDVYNQEVLAQFIENAGAVFRNILACLYTPNGSEDHSGHRIVIGADWGKQADFTALSAGCADCRRELELDRFNQIDYHFQRQRLQAMYERLGASVVLAEQNAMGEPIIDELRREGLNVRGFQTTASSKPPLIENLALAFEREEWRFLDVPVATAELQAYERRVSPTTGRASYSAPDRQNDDTVIGRALMLRATERQTLRSGSADFYAPQKQEGPEEPAGRSAEEVDEILSAYGN